MGETNLQRILREKNISTSAVAAVTGVSQTQTIVRKLRREYPFKLGEAMKINKELLPEYSFFYLFDEYMEVNEAA